MKIQLKDWKINHLNFSEGNININQENDDNLFKLNVDRDFPEDNSRKFSILFNFEIKNEKFELEISSTFNFAVDEVIDEKFKISDFPRVNAPAIAFPYLRAYISNFTLQSGFNPVMLSSINFVKFPQKSE